MNVSRWLPIAVSTLALPCSIASFAAPKASPADVEAFVKALPAPGSHDRAFLAVPAALMARLAIAPATIHAIDPGLACDPASRTLGAFQAELGSIGQLQMLCTPDGRSHGTITLQNGASYETICGDALSATLTANLDVHVGEHSWHASTDSAPPTREPAHSCTGWVKLPG